MEEEITKNKLFFNSTKNTLLVVWRCLQGVIGVHTWHSCSGVQVGAGYNGHVIYHLATGKISLLLKTYFASACISYTLRVSSRS